MRDRVQTGARVTNTPAGAGTVGTFKTSGPHVQGRESNMLAIGGCLMLFVLAFAGAAVAYYGTLGVVLALLWVGKVVFRVR